MKGVCFSVHGIIDCGRKSLMLMWRCQQLLFGFVAKGDLHQVSRQSYNDKGGWDDTGGCAQISWHLPHSWGKPRKTSARRQSLKAVLPVIVSNGDPYLQMRSVGSHSTSGMEKEGKKERMGWEVVRKELWKEIKTLT